MKFVILLPVTVALMMFAQEATKPTGPTVGDKQALSEVQSLRIQKAFSDYNAALARLESANTTLNIACREQLQQAGLPLDQWGCGPDGMAIRQKLEPKAVEPAKASPSGVNVPEAKKG